MSFLSIEHITKTYKGASSPCLKDLCLNVGEGEILVLLGPSGCGKTTLLKIIAGLEDKDAGSVSIDGECIDALSTEKRPISMVFQKPFLFKNMDVFNNIAFAPKVTGQFRDKEEMMTETQRYIDIVKMTGFEHRSATQLSGGQEQRVSLARALIVKPKLLLLDEPLSALDASLRVEMRTAIRKICKELNQTVVFVTHDQEEAVAVGDRIALMDSGIIIQHSVPEEFYSHPRTLSVARFFGWKNYIPCIFDGKGKIDSPIGAYHIDIPDTEPGDMVLVMRPESFYENADGPIKGIVKDSCFMGTRVDYEVEVNGHTIYASLDTSYLRRRGDSISLDINRSGLWAVRAEPELKQTVEPQKESRLNRLFAKIKKK